MAKIRIAFLVLIMLIISTQVVLAQGEIVLKAGCDQPPGEHFVYLSLTTMKAELERMSDGRVTMEIFHSAQLGSEEDMLEQLKIGALDILAGGFPNASRYFPELGFFSASYLFESFDHINNVLENQDFVDRVKEVVENRNEGILLLAPSSMGVRYHYNNRRPIRNIQDMAGIKIRVMANPIESRVWSAFGAIPDPLPHSEIYNAMQTGVIDGAESSISVIYDRNYYEIGPYINMTQHQFALSGVFMSQQKYDRFPADVQEMIDEAALTAAKLCMEVTENNDTKYLLKLLQEPGVIITATDKRGFIEAAIPIQIEEAEKAGMVDIYNLIKEIAKQ